MRPSTIGVIAVLALAGAAGLAWHLTREPTAAAVPSAGDPPVPVVADTVRTQDVPIYLSGIGTVQAFNTVTIRSRVDGQVDKIAFAEGQDVKAGDLLAQIDPRPFAVQLGYTRITAPISGRTGMRLVDQGNIVHASDQTGLVVVTQIEPISLVFSLPEDALPDVARAMSGDPLRVAAFSRDDRTELADGTLALIDNQIDQTTGSIRLKATFANKDHALWPGQFVNARLCLTIRRGSATVPAAVVQRGPQGTYAYVIRSDSTVEMRPITVAQLRDGVALIDSGLSAGEQVVVDGQYKLRPGLRVDARAAPSS